MRAVLDPNVLVAALLSAQGTPAKIILAWLAGGFDLVTSPELTMELANTLAYPKIRKRITQEEAGEFIDLLLRTALITDDPAEAPSIHSPDPDDDYLIALAEASAAVLVSGDSDLLDLNGGLPIYSPRDFLELIQVEPPLGA